MEEIIIYKGGRNSGGVDGAMKVTREDSGNVFIEVNRPNNFPLIVRFSPDVAQKLGDVLTRMSGMVP